MQINKHNSINYCPYTVYAIYTIYAVYAFYTVYGVLFSIALLWLLNVYNTKYQKVLPLIMEALCDYSVYFCTAIKRAIISIHFCHPEVHEF